ncbi:serine/threonine-protein kinase Nek6-like [Patiria miniata]|uniref:non-specific serine/threonine protein kinase n=1 Tax=Patiria miniata TaxID=46514 RepID=A0A913ZJ20_PATMI|nr:serine/threonine-protein kinase Nek6-like [Patiria miniata]XP_038051793.1 serine/threonine-protein kinase Nek6-like [Patiria miniata]
MEMYDKVTTLGTGSGGAVYLVRHKETKKLQALKKIQLDEKRKTRTREAVQREANILSELRHPHIVTYYESFFEETPDAVHLCIVQDYCDGGNLDEKIQRHKNRGENLEESQIMQWFIQLLMAVQYIHSMKILHRDLKAQNVFLTKKNMLKLGDFGIARTLEHTIDKASTCVGTPCYLSPELCQDIPYNNKSDLWALGCLLFEMCAFAPAFDANNLISLFYKIVKCEYAEIPSMYSDDMKQLIAAILVKEPDQRPGANALLAFPFVQKHLNLFITEKEVQWQQVLLVRQSIDSNASDNGSKAKKADHSHNIDTPVRRPLEPKDSGEYSDDFSSSENGDDDDDDDVVDEVLSECSSKNGDEDIEEIVEEVVGSCSDDDDADPSRGLLSPSPHSSAATPSPNHNGGKTPSPLTQPGDQEYADDFEDVDSDANLKEILSHARTAIGVEANYEDDFEDEMEEEQRPTSRCKQLLREHCIDSLGEEVFAKIQAQCGKRASSSPEELSQDMVSLQLKHTVENDHMETCYLVSELLGETAAT